MKICLIDDDRTLLSSLAAVLTRAGHDVYALDQGTEIADVVFATGADLVICDLLMPGTEGMEVLRSVKQRIPGTRFIMMSGVVGELAEFLDQAKRMGADAVLQKPFAPDELIEVIASVCGVPC